MIVSEALEYYAQQLPRNEVELILSKITGLTRTQLKTWPEKYLEQDIIQQFKAYCERRIAGEPIAYLFKEREFWSLPLMVDKNVLIPRHETESLVEYCVAFYPNDSQLRCLDLGTGSGAIALALASQFAAWQVYAIDRSVAALHIAAKNAQSLGYTQVGFINADWLNCVKEAAFDLIISNPPYIATDDPHLEQGDLRFEPKQALVAPALGLADLSKIIAQAARTLTPHGQLILEHGFEQGLSVRNLLQSHHYQKIQTFQDYAGHERFTVGFKK